MKDGGAGDLVAAASRRRRQWPGAADAGCGTGRNLQEFGALGAAQGVDNSPEAIDFCRRRGIQGVREGQIEQLPFADGSFDLVLATDVLEHLADDRVALRELHRVAAPGGRLLATVPAYRWLWSQHDDEHHHFRRYTLRRLRDRLRATGWEPLAWSYFNTALLVPIAVVRLLARRRPGGRRAPRPATHPAGTESATGATDATRGGGDRTRRAPSRGRVDRDRLRSALARDGHWLRCAARTDGPAARREAAGSDR